MKQPVAMVEVWRGAFREVIHKGHAVICDADGQIVQSWGDPNLVFLPRSAVKIIQALPLVETGAADAFGLSDRQLSLACASHISSDIHIQAVKEWLAMLGLSDNDLACGPQEPRDIAVRDALIRAEEPVCRCHNNCSGKHSGMLTLARHLGADLDYVSPSNPVQKAILATFEDLTGAKTRGYGIDGCSAPNYAFSLKEIARAMAYIAWAPEDGSPRERAAARLRRAMAAHPEMVSGDGEACTELMRAMGGKVTIKGGAEGSYTAILPEHGLGIAVKIMDGAQRAQQAAITALLVHMGVLDPDHPAARRWMMPVQKNFAGLETGVICPAPGFPA